MTGGPKLSDDTRTFDWMNDGAVRKVIAALTAGAPDAARFVGGCVRDSLIGDAPKDIDIATTLTPDETIAALTAAGLKYAPTGVDHGTITAIADHRGIEVTTLRADVSTDGRRATVAFTKDWAVDASRRDFTLNAIYLTPDGKIFDPVGGVADAKAGRVRFIGDARDRIREDYLRILRFFRFSARFAGEGIDAEGLAACAVLKEGISNLSAERVGDEMMKLLALPAPSAALSAMAASGVLAAVWPHAAQLEVFARLKTLDAAAGGPLGLAALWGEAGEGLGSVLRLSKADASRRRIALEGARALSPAINEKDARAMLYRLGVRAWSDGVLLAHAEYLAASDTPGANTVSAFTNLRSLPGRWRPPKFPFTGKHVIALGVPAGPDVARAIKEVEKQWIAEDFPPLARATEILKEVVTSMERKRS